MVKAEGRAHFAVRQNDLRIFMVSITKDKI